MTLLISRNLAVSCYNAGSHDLHDKQWTVTLEDTQKIVESSSRRQQIQGNTMPCQA
jgi:hypothetical protein